MKLRKATHSDTASILQIMSQARDAQRKAGFFQWADNYPSVETIESDISNEIGYILDDEGSDVGYIVIAFDDQEYNNHSEIWNTSIKYAVLHRIAISDSYRGQGISGILFDLSETLIASLGVFCIRIDTGIENLPMRHILSSRSYTCLGVCDFIWGKRLAYEKYI